MRHHDEITSERLCMVGDIPPGPVDGLLGHALGVEAQPASFFDGRPQLEHDEQVDEELERLKAKMGQGGASVETESGQEKSE